MESGSSKMWINSDFDITNCGRSLSNFAPPVSYASSKKRKKRTLLDVSSLSNNLSISSQLQPWTICFAPTCVNELVVHPKKIEQVRTWLDRCFSNNYHQRKKLLLSGPTGSGKSITLLLLAKEMGIRVLEWINPSDTLSFSDVMSLNKFDSSDRTEYVSEMQAFCEFLRRAQRYNMLPLQVGSSDDQQSVTKRLVLVKEFPALAFHNPIEFRNILGSSLSHIIHPLIFIHTGDDDKLFSAFENHEGFDKIVFNPVTAIKLVRALYLVMTQAGKQVGGTNQENLMNLAISANGDVRSAINALQFAETNTNPIVSPSPMPKTRKRNKPQVGWKNRLKSVNTVGNTVATNGSKDTSLGLFRALGKVLYCKREDGILLFNPESVLKNVDVSSDAFTCFLHHNYLEFKDCIHDVALASDIISYVDPFFSEWTTNGKISVSDYGGLISIRGLCYSKKSQHTTETRGLRTFNKPTWYNIAKETRSRKRELQSELYFNDNHTELVCNFIPAITKITVVSNGIVDRIGRFNQLAAKTASLGNKLASVKFTTFINQLSCDNDDNVSQETDELDFLIEEVND